MAWTWRYEGPDGCARCSPPRAPRRRSTFPNQSDAETWIGETWRELLEAGVHQVVLFDGDREVYGPMGLNAVLTIDPEEPARGRCSESTGRAPGWPPRSALSRPLAAAARGRPGTVRTVEAYGPGPLQRGEWWLPPGEHGGDAAAADRRAGARRLLAARLRPLAGGRGRRRPRGPRLPGVEPRLHGGRRRLAGDAARRRRRRTTTCCAAAWPAGSTRPAPPSSGTAPAGTSPCGWPAAPGCPRARPGPARPRRRPRSSSRRPRSPRSSSGAREGLGGGAVARPARRHARAGARSATGSPTRSRWRPPGCRCVLLHSRADALVPYAQSEAYAGGGAGARPSSSRCPATTSPTSTRRARRSRSCAGPSAASRGAWPGLSVSDGSVVTTGREHLVDAGLERRVEPHAGRPPRRPRSCSGRDAPTIAALTPSSCSTHATARPAMRQARPRRRAGLSCCTASSTSSRIQRWIMSAPPVGVGGARALRRRLARQVLAGQHALRDRRPDDLPDALVLAQRQHLGLDDAPERAVLRLRRHDAVEAHLARRSRSASRDLRRLPLADPDVVHLAGADEVVERPQGLLERRLVVEAVRLVEVDRVGLQPPQRRVAGLQDVLARQAAVVRARRRSASRPW